MRRPPHRQAYRFGRVASAVTALALLSAAPASAHEGEKAKAAADDVRQAIAYIVNQPGNMGAIQDKVHDALDSTDTHGVDLTLVKRAQRTLNSSGSMDTQLMRARLLLQEAIGARPDLLGTDVRPILGVPRGASGVHLSIGDETGTGVVYDALPGRDDLTGVDYTLLASAGALALAGFVLARRWRPHDSIRALKRRLVTSKAA